LLDLASLQSAARVQSVKQGNLRAFARRYWHIVEPGAPLVDSWAFGAVCEFLTAWRRREFYTGVISVPPGNSKSLTACALFPVWSWTEDATRKIWCASHAQDLVLRDAGRSKAILQHAQFQEDFPHVQLAPNKDALAEIWTTAGGLRFSSTVGGGGIGWHFHDVVIDDPCKPQNILGASRAHIEIARRWRTGTVPTRRAEPPSEFGLMLIMQRLTEDDLAGEELKKEGVAHLCLPARYVPKAHWIIGDWSSRLDPRSEPGELLNPERFPERVLRELEVELGANASAQLQQNPIPRTGGLVEEQWLRWEWIDIPYRGLWVQEWDLSGKGTNLERHSAVCGQLWCAHETSNVRELLDSISDREKSGRAESRPVSVAKAVRWHLVDEVWGVWPFEETLRQMVQAQSRPLWNRAPTVRVEEKASGIQALQVLRSKIPGIISSAVATPEHLKDDKLSRFRPLVPPAAEAGLILLPPWRRSEGVGGQETGPDAFRKELLAFPRGVRDDRVDCASSAAAFFQVRSGAWQDTIMQLAKQGWPG
jgi:phage terminase large subunit-like protein